MISPARRAFALAAFAVALATLLVVVRRAPPAAAGVDAPADRFSAARALPALGRILGSGAPHPTGSPEAERVRGVIADELRAAGYAPEEQRDVACSAYRACALVTNVLARRTGREPGKGVLFVAHSDSVGAGPGASDDGVGVAVLLEVARRLAAFPPPRRDVMFLVDDGEESGLVGARAFVDDHPWASRVGVVVNVEARGTSGRSLMFETSGDNAWLVEALAGGVPSPSSSSLFAAVYELLPNDTDLSVFKASGMPGVNFAFLDRVTQYHTPRDDLAHVDARSVQHHGDNALAMVRALAERDLDAPPRGRAVWFDVVGLFLVRWPEPATLPLALLSLVALALALVAMLRRGAVRPSALVLGFAAFVLGPLAAALFTAVLSVVLRALGVTPRPFLAHPAAVVTAAWALGVTAALAAACLFRRAGAAGLWGGGWIAWTLVAVALAARAPAFAYLFVVPSLVAALLALGSVAARRRELPQLAAVVAPAVVAALLWCPLALSLDAALGVDVLPAVAAVVALVAAEAAPFLADLDVAALRFSLVVPVVVAVGAAGLASLRPPIDADAPERMSLAMHLDADAGVTRWIASPETGVLPPAMRSVMRVESALGPPFPWSGASAFTGLAPAWTALPPELAGVERTNGPRGRRARGRIVSPRGAPEIRIAFAPGAPIVELSLGGRVVPAANRRLERRLAGWQVATFRGVPPGGVEIEVVIGGAAEVSAVLVDAAPGLGAAGAPLGAARPPDAAPSGEGDLTLVSRRVKL